ncbi:MAG: hypothetical protein JWP59_19 [Massilia sp.]|nr:hypothetical protein [Massilia sp.]
MRRLFALCLLVPVFGNAVAGAATPSTAPAETADSQARALFAADWNWRLQNQPELATALGDARFNSQWSDTSLAASLAANDHEKKALEQARQIDANKLTGNNRLSLEVFIDQKERRIKAATFYPYRYAPLTNQDGLHVNLPRVVVQMPFATEADYRAYLARIEALPAHVDGLIEQMREGQKLGWSAPKTALRLVPGLLRQLRESVAGGGMLERPFREIPATIPKAVRDELAQAGPAALRTRAAPALLKLEDYVRLEALPAARDTIGILGVPAGTEYYQFLLQDSTELAPAAVHALGIKEVARIRAEMAAAIARTGFKGSFAQFATFANSDTRLFASDPDKLLRRYRRQLARATAAASRLFANLPAEALAVRQIQDGADDQGAAYYEAASEARPAAIVVNTSKLATRPLWETATLVLHEGVPGHHLQVARARELQDLPAFRRYGWNAPYGEGWALYAESLGTELGLYNDPFSAFGRLNSDLLRSARLVADTGIHAMGWSRQQAIDYLNANTANNGADNEVEVDRYIAAPGQALAYKLGQLRFKALREKAQAALGERFDIRRFHAAVLDNGALPLPLLEQQVERSIRALTAAPPPARSPAPG